MTQKQWTLVAVAVVLAGLCLYVNRDWFTREGIQIYHRSSQRMPFFRRGRPDNSAVNPVFFGFSQKLKLTEVKVISVGELATNKYPHALWNLVSESNSVPTKGFAYGMFIPGMHPKVKGVPPDPLEPGVQYRLIVQAGSQKGEHDFAPTPRTPAP